MWEEKDLLNENSLNNLLKNRLKYRNSLKIQNRKAVEKRA